MPRTRKSASPLATFLQFILTAPIHEGTAALEASLAAFEARKSVTSPTNQVRRGRPVVEGAGVSTGTVSTPATLGKVLAGPGPVAAPPAAATKPAKPAAAPKPPAAAAAPATPTRRRGRPPVTAAAAVAAAPVIGDVPAGAAPLPDQTVDQEA